MKSVDDWLREYEHRIFGDDDDDPGASDLSAMVEMIRAIQADAIRAAAERITAGKSGDGHHLDHARDLFAASILNLIPQS